MLFFVAVNVPWNFYDTRTSSRTRCSRMTEEILAAQKGFQQTALARLVIHNQDTRRVRRRFGHFGWHSPRLDKSTGRQKKFSKARWTKLRCDLVCLRSRHFEVWHFKVLEASVA